MHAFTIVSLAKRSRRDRDNNNNGGRKVDQPIGSVGGTGGPDDFSGGLDGEEEEVIDMNENVHCVNGYCIDRKYNKLELPTAGKTHVKMNLEVRSQ